MLCVSPSHRHLGGLFFYFFFFFKHKLLKERKKTLKSSLKKNQDEVGSVQRVGFRSRFLPSYKGFFFPAASLPVIGHNWLCYDPALCKQSQLALRRKTVLRPCALLSRRGEVVGLTPSASMVSLACLHWNSSSSLSKDQPIKS